jgi:hypothetical protein
MHVGGPLQASSIMRGDSLNIAPSDLVMFLSLFWATLITAEFGGALPATGGAIIWPGFLATRALNHCAKTVLEQPTSWTTARNVQEVPGQH